MTHYTSKQLAKYGKEKHVCPICSLSSSPTGTQWALLAPVSWAIGVYDNKTTIEVRHHCQSHGEVWHRTVI